MQTLKRTTIQFLGMMLLCLCTQLVSAQSVNFTGTWKLNLEKTKAPGVNTSSYSPLIKISLEDHAMIIYRIKGGQDEKTAYRETLKLDGSPSESETPSKLKRSSVFKWSADGKSFTEDYVSKDTNGNTIQVVKQIWALSVDGKTLMIKDDFKQGERAFISDLAYEKQ